MLIQLQTQLTVEIRESLLGGWPNIYIGDTQIGSIRRLPASVAVYDSLVHKVDEIEGDPTTLDEAAVRLLLDHYAAEALRVERESR